MKKIAGILIFVLMFSQVSFARTILDVPETDSAYKYIDEVISMGLLSIYSDGKFRPNATVSRKELAIVLSRVEKKNKQIQSELQSADIQELKSLAESFKNYLSKYEATDKLNNARFLELETEQKVMNQDISGINEDVREELKKLRKEMEENNLRLIIGGIVLAGFAIALK